MTTVVLLVLAIIWGVLLVSWLRSRTEGTFADSVGTFRRHLTVLERTTPSVVAPANRLRSGPVAGRSSIPPYRASSRIPGQGLAPHRPAGPVARPMAARPQAPAARRRSQKRRRDVFFALIAGVIGSLLLSVVSGVSAMWTVQVVFDLCFTAYVALLIRMRNLAAERELKLTFMPHSTRPSRPRPAYEMGASGYGELDLQRAAN
ncbi:MAG TPA: hypothetical protein VFJ79_01780 [Acidimicrobiales bacterium]|nr:hypothetical protein [Acidimicrobiales bacterium]